MRVRIPAQPGAAALSEPSATLDTMLIDELAERAGLTAAFVRRLCDLGLLGPDDDGSFTEGDLMRARLMAATERAGVPLEGVRAAVEAGRFSLAFLDMPHYRWSPLTDTTFAQLSETHDVDLEYLVSIEESQGSERPGPDDRVRQDVVEMIPLTRLALDGGIDPEVMPRLARTYADAMRRIAEAEGSVFHRYVEMPLLAAGLGQREVTEMANAFGAAVTPMQEAMLINMYRRQQELVWTAHTIEHMETALDEMGLRPRPDRPPAIVFMDLSGFTRLTEERGDEVAADLAGRLGALAQRVASAHGGRPVKWLGDGVMFVFPDPGEAVAAAVRMVAEAPTAGLPDAHIGVAAGAVIAQDGDYYGRTVNLAARLAGHAGPRRILVDDEVIRLAGESFAHTPAGSISLKGFPEPIGAHQITT